MTSLKQMNEPIIAGLIGMGFFGFGFFATMFAIAPAVQTVDHYLPANFKEVEYKSLAIELPVGYDKEMQAREVAEIKAVLKKYPKGIPVLIMNGLKITQTTNDHIEIDFNNYGGAIFNNNFMNLSGGFKMQ